MFGKLPARGGNVTRLGSLQLGFLERDRFAVLGCQPWFWIEQVQLRGAAWHVQEQASLGARRVVRRQRGQRIKRSRIGRRQFPPEQGLQCQSAEARAGPAQRLATRELLPRM